MSFEEADSKKFELLPYWNLAESRGALSIIDLDLRPSCMPTNIRCDFEMSSGRFHGTILDPKNFILNPENYDLKAIKSEEDEMPQKLEEARWFVYERLSEIYEMSRDCKSEDGHIEIFNRDTVALLRFLEMRLRPPVLEHNYSPLERHELLSGHRFNIDQDVLRDTKLLLVKELIPLLYEASKSEKGFTLRDNPNARDEIDQVMIWLDHFFNLEDYILDIHNKFSELQYKHFVQGTVADFREFLRENLGWGVTDFTHSVDLDYQPMHPSMPSWLVCSGTHFTQLDNLRLQRKHKKEKGHDDRVSLQMLRLVYTAAHEATHMVKCCNIGSDLSRGRLPLSFSLYTPFTPINAGDEFLTAGCPLEWRIEKSGFMPLAYKIAMLGRTLHKLVFTKVLQVALTQGGKRAKQFMIEETKHNGMNKHGVLDSVLDDLVDLSGNGFGTHMVAWHHPGVIMAVSAREEMGAGQFLKYLQSNIKKLTDSHTLIDSMRFHGYEPPFEKFYDPGPLSPSELRNDINKRKIALSREAKQDPKHTLPDGPSPED